MPARTREASFPAGVGEEMVHQFFLLQLAEVAVALELRRGADDGQEHIVLPAPFGRVSMQRRPGAL